MREARIVQLGSHITASSIVTTMAAGKRWKLCYGISFSWLDQDASAAQESHLWERWKFTNLLDKSATWASFYGSVMKNSLGCVPHCKFKRAQKSIYLCICSAYVMHLHVIWTLSQAGYDGEAHDDDGGTMLQLEQQSSCWNYIYSSSKAPAAAKLWRLG